MDYIFRWLQLRFTGQQQLLFENLRPKSSVAPYDPSNGPLVGEGSGSTTGGVEQMRPGRGSVHAADALADIVDLGDAPTCSFCGSIMTRNGSCYRCGSCGSTSGCS
jgi:ribonucleoside-diphosphate reductase alpha chain